MTVSQLIEKLELTVFAVPDAQREVSGGYVGDLLSWVMGRARTDEAWITIMSNQNVAAVAALAEVQGINLLGTGKSAFAAAVELDKVL